MWDIHMAILILKIIVYLKFKFYWASYVLSGNSIYPAKRKPLGVCSMQLGICVFVYYSVFILGSHLEETLETLQKCGPQF